MIAKPSTVGVRKMSLVSVGPQRIVLDILFVSLAYSAAGIFYWHMYPYIRGFYCDDESIRYPFKPSTVTEAMLYALGFALPILTIIGVETLRFFWYDVRYNGRKPEAAYAICGRSVHPYAEQLYRYCGIYLMGASCNIFLTDVGKYTVGRLRPHFIAVCDPNWSQIDCSSNYTYMMDYECRGDPLLIREARLSFPSGHSSFSFYAMVFSVIYLQSRARFTMGSHVSRAMLQLLYIAMAFFTALSRVSDYKHHWSDVLAGSMLGSLVACVFALHVARLFRYFRSPLVIRQRETIGVNRRKACFDEPDAADPSVEFAYHDPLDAPLSDTQVLPSFLQKSGHTQASPIN